jgi:hypothetical protein
LTPAPNSGLAGVPLLEKIIMRALQFACAFIVLLWTAQAVAEDRHAGYYYPEVTSTEAYEVRAPILDGNDRTRRRNFISGLIREISEKPYPPTYALFAKGSDSEKLIVISVRDGFFDTLYRSRALMAALSAMARGTPLFKQLDADDNFIFFDLCYMLGFTQVTISDGRDFAHQVKFLSPSVGGKASSKN